MYDQGILPFSNGMCSEVCSLSQWGGTRCGTELMMVQSLCVYCVRLTVRGHVPPSPRPVVVVYRAMLVPW